MYWLFRAAKARRRALSNMITVLEEKGKSVRGEENSTSGKGLTFHSYDDNSAENASHPFESA